MKTYEFDTARHLILLVGPNGAGKKTLAGRLQKFFKKHFGQDISHIEAGEICRHPLNYGVSPTVADGLIEASNGGDLVSDDLIYEAIRTVLDRSPEDRFIALDGFPRTVDQFEMILRWAMFDRRQLTIAFAHTPMDVCLSRMEENARGRQDDAERDVRLNRINTFIKVTCDMIKEMRRAHFDRFISIDGTDMKTVDIWPVFRRIIPDRIIIKKYTELMLRCPDECADWPIRAIMNPTNDPHIYSRIREATLTLNS